MSEPIAYCCGKFVPFSQLSVPVWDSGFVLGASVTEQLRTFRGELFRWKDHVRRLEHSLAVVGIDPPLAADELYEVAARLIAENFPQLLPGRDLGLSIVITPGPYGSMAPEPGGSAVYLHTYPLAFARWARQYETGAHLVTTGVTQVPASCWPPELKCRSRMHYYLADQQADRKQAGAKALLLDEAGRVRESSIANVLLCRDAGSSPQVLSPPRREILPGISLDVTRKLVQQIGWQFEERELTLPDVEASDEIWLSSTPWCLLPVTRFERQPVGSGSPGPRFAQLLAAWNDLVGLDIAQQAQDAIEE